MTQSVFHVNAFASGPFEGNPAAVFPVDRWYPDELMQKMTAEAGITSAFIVGECGRYEIRWFTPATEIDGICGHGTLAAAFVIANELGDPAQELTFDTAVGELKARPQASGKFILDLPALEPKPIPPHRDIEDALGCRPEELVGALDLIAVLASEADVLDFEPRLSQLAKLPLRAVVVTAPGEDVDFVSRWFGPKHGDGEDIGFTGSAHCSLVPYWSRRLGKSNFMARQPSPRGTTLRCELHEDRVWLACSAVKYMEGKFFL